MPVRSGGAVVRAGPATTRAGSPARVLLDGRPDRHPRARTRWLHRRAVGQHRPPRRLRAGDAGLELRPSNRDHGRRCPASPRCRTAAVRLRRIVHRRSPHLPVLTDRRRPRAPRQARASDGSRRPSGRVGVVHRHHGRPSPRRHVLGGCGHRLPRHRIAPNGARHRPPRRAERTSAASARPDRFDPDTANHAFDGYFGPTTFVATLADFYCADLVVHAWDIASAVGLEEYVAIDANEMTAIRAGLERVGATMRQPGLRCRS